MTPPPETPASTAAGTHRQVELTRTGPLRLRATNVRGGTLDLSSGEDGDPDFTPVELLLVALAGCSAIDIESITSKRSDPVHFDVTAGAEKVRDGNGNHLTDVTLDFDVEFPDTEGGAKAAGVLRRAMEMTVDRLCTVSRTVELATPVRVRVRGEDLRSEEAARGGEQGEGGTGAS